MNMRARLGKLEAGVQGDPRAGLDPALWPLIGSRYMHEDFIEIVAAESAATAKGIGDGKS